MIKNQNYFSSIYKKVIINTSQLKGVRIQAEILNEITSFPARSHRLWLCLLEQLRTFQLNMTHNKDIIKIKGL